MGFSSALAQFEINSEVIFLALDSTLVIFLVTGHQTEIKGGKISNLRGAAHHSGEGLAAELTLSLLVWQEGACPESRTRSNRNQTEATLAPTPPPATQFLQPDLAC